MAEPTLRDILDALLRLNSKFDHWESRMDRIERRLDILVENASPQAPAPAPIDDEAPSDEPSANEPSIDEPSNDTCQTKPPCKPIYEPLRRYIKLSIRR
jgi:hypothetical protein